MKGARLKPSSRGFLQGLAKPWVQFFFFLFLNVWFSFFVQPFSAVWVLGFMAGILFLLVWLPGIGPSFQGKPSWTVESLPSISIYWLLAVVTLALVARLYKLTTVPVWPVSDEGEFLFNALHCAQSGDSRLYFTHEYMPPAFFWVFGFFLKLVPPSLFSLWLFPTLISLATLVLGYAACRQFCSKSFSFFWALGWALGFWPLYTSHFCVPQTLLPLWGCWCLFLFGLYRKAPNPTSQLRHSLYFGVALGMGFYIFFLLWALAALLLGTAFVLSLRSVRSPRQIGALLLRVFGPVLLFSLPLLLVRAHLPVDSMAYWNQLWIFKNGFSGTIYGSTAASYVTGLFWGVDATVDYFGYRTFWGGFFNPLLGAVFFVGFVAMFRFGGNRVTSWFLAAFFLFLAPAWLTNNLEMFRIVFLMPFCLAGVAMGFQILFYSLKNPLKMTLLVGIWGLSFGLDFYHLTVVDPRFWETHVEKWDSYAKQRECYEAYQILKALRKDEGPGLVLTGFSAPLDWEPLDQTLLLACYPFNAGQNPDLAPQKARWAAVFVPSPDKPFLSRRFPMSRWKDLGPDLFRTNDAHFLMMLLPVTTQNHESLLRWVTADQFLQKMIYERLNPASSDYRSQIEGWMTENHPLFEGDPFLETHFWNLMEANAIRDKDWKAAVEAVQQAVQKGYPKGREYFRMGTYWVRLGNYSKARKAFWRAGKMEPSLMPPPSVFEKLRSGRIPTSKAFPGPTGEKLL